MLKYRFTVNGASRELDLDSCLISEAAECEALTGGTWDEFRDGLAKSSAISCAFSWWIANKRAGTPLDCKFSEVDFDVLAYVRDAEFIEPEPADQPPAPEQAGPTSPVSAPAPEPPTSSPPTAPPSSPPTA